MNDTQTNQSTGAVHLTDQTFDQALSGGKPVFVDFYATWCGPCQIAGPIIDRLSKEYADRVLVAKLDVDEYNALAKKYGVMSIPTVIVFKKEGDEVKEVTRLVGFSGEPAYRKLLDMAAPAKSA
jgi:thioredoxin 1